MAFTEDGRFVATGHADGTVRVHRTPPLPWAPPDARGRGGTRMELVAVSGGPTDQPAGPGGATSAAPSAAAAAAAASQAVASLAFSANGTASVLLACGGHDRCVRLLELRFDHTPDVSDEAVRTGDGYGLAPPRADKSTTRRLSGALVPRCCCRGHTQAVTHVDFSPDGSLMMSCCAGREVILWALPGGARVKVPDRLATDTPWLAGTSVVGFDRMGIWGHRPDGSPVTAVHSAHAIPATGRGGAAGARVPFNDTPHQTPPPHHHHGGVGGGAGGGGAHARVGASAASRAALATPGMLPQEHTYDRSGLLITAGDDGDVRLLRAPCVVAAAPARHGASHCDRVACARFLNGGRGAVSAGLYDRLVVRWDIA